jgi:hypothetical protein
MKKATLIVAGLLLGLMACSAVFAYKIPGYVYFDTTKTKRARCCEVALFGDYGCYSADSLTMTTVDYAGYYEFDGLPGGGQWYSVRARWGFAFCVQCDTAGTECDQLVYSECENAYLDDTDAEQDLIFDIDCRCTQDDPT